jgi:hypothetical protein
MTTRERFVNNRGQIHGKCASYQGRHMDDKVHEGIRVREKRKVIVIQCDDQSVVSLTKNPTQHA